MNAVVPISNDLPRFRILTSRPAPRLRYCRVVEASTRGVADRLRAQFRRADGRWEAGMEDLWARLVAMGDCPPLHAVVELLGSREWTHPRCAATGDYVETAVELGEAGGQVVLVGVETLREAMTLVEG